MKLTIIAATGGVGQQLLEQALDAGHDVTAVVRNPGKLSRKVHAVTTDLTAPDPAALASAIAGADAVLSGLGPHSNADAGIAQRGTRRSEEHTSELQSRENLVCRLLLEKKKKRDFVQQGYFSKTKKRGD